MTLFLKSESLQYQVEDPAVGLRAAAHLFLFVLCLVSVFFFFSPSVLT